MTETSRVSRVLGAGQLDQLSDKLSFKGSTPKYAVNNGIREEGHRGTLARMFVRVPTAEWQQFKDSVGDDNLRERVLSTLAGDPSVDGVGGNRGGYVDFLIQQADQRLEEKVFVSEGLADNYVVYYFGQRSPVWTYSGALLNTYQDDQLVNFLRIYAAVVRGTQLARRSKSVILSYDSWAVKGTIESLTWQHNAANELFVPFSFTFRVKQITDRNYNAAWRPTSLSGARGPDVFDPRFIEPDAPGVSRPASNVTRASVPTGAVRLTAPTPTAPPEPDDAVTSHTDVVTDGPNGEPRGNPATAASQNDTRTSTPAASTPSTETNVRDGRSPTAAPATAAVPQGLSRP